MWYCDASGKHITGHNSDLSDIDFGELGVKFNVARIHFGRGTKKKMTYRASLLPPNWIKQTKKLDCKKQFNFIVYFSPYPNDTLDL